MNAEEIRAVLAERERATVPLVSKIGPHEHAWSKVLEIEENQQLERCTACPATRRRPVEWFTLSHGFRVMVVEHESEWSLST